MKIEDNRNNAMSFNELAVGDVFEYEGDYYMKISEVHDEDRKDVSYMTYNAVIIDSSCVGKLSYFTADLVHLLDDVTLVLN